MLKRGQRQTGFTIVELLIVIVVIGILAAITIVAFNGIQQRARNTQRVTVAKDWQKIITAYATTNTSYPSGMINNHYCLGSEGYPTNFDVNADVDCFGTGNIKHPLASANTAFGTIASLPKYPGDSIVTGAAIGTVVGISLRAQDTLDPAGTPKIQYPMLQYWLHGTNQDCVLRPVAQSVAGGYVQGTATSTGNQGPATLCVILLPDPASL
ncbi:MAG: type II secretion system protein [Patescibacteria group bacterium]